MRKKSTLNDIFKESWHKLYPNKKRKKIKFQTSKRYLFFKLLDKLIELNFEEKVYVMSSIGYDLFITKSSHYDKCDNSIQVNFISEKNIFSLKQIEIKNNINIDHGILSYEETLKMIITIVNKWERDMEE